MNRNNAVNRQFARVLTPLAILFASLFQCSAQSQDQTGTVKKTTVEDGIIVCRFSELDIYVDVEVKDRRGKFIPYLDRKNILVYEDGVRQDMSAFIEQSDGKYLLRYQPTNMVFDGKKRKVRIDARTSDGRKLRVSSRLRPDPENELRFKVDVYPQGYSIQELPRKN